MLSVGSWFCRAGVHTHTATPAHSCRSTSLPTYAHSLDPMVVWPSAGGSEGGWKRRLNGVYNHHQRVPWRNGLLFLFLFTCSSRATAEDQQHQQHHQQRWKDTQRKRSGDVAGLEDGRLSLAKVSAMLTSSVHTEVSNCFLVRFSALLLLVAHEFAAAAAAAAAATVLLCVGLALLRPCGGDEPRCPR